MKAQTSNTVPFVRPYDLETLPWWDGYRLRIWFRWWWNFRIRGAHYLRGTLTVGERFIWDYDNPHARERVQLVEARWNGEEWWVLLRSMDRKDRHEPSKWMECWTEAEDMRLCSVRMNENA